MANPTLKLQEETSMSMKNYSPHVDETELGACCLPSTSASTSGASAMYADMSRPEIDFFEHQIDKSSTDYCNELEELIQSLPNDLEKKINLLKSATTSADSTSAKNAKAEVKYAFENQLIDFLYGSVIRDAELALHEVQNQPGTKKSGKMVEYYSKHFPFIVGLAKQEKASCIDDNGVCCDEVRFKELERAEECLDKLAKCFAEIGNSPKN